LTASPAIRKARRSLTLLGIIIVALIGVISIGLFRGEATPLPKLALDLQGGTQILLAPKTTDGSAISNEQVQQAVSIIRQRVDAAGVSESEITTMGGQNISVAIPGKADDETLRRIEASARLDFRPVLANGMANQSTQENGDGATADKSKDSDKAEGSSNKSDSDKANADSDKKKAAAQDEKKSDSDGDKGDKKKGEKSPPNDDDSLYPDPLPKKAGTLDWVTPELGKKFEEFSCDSEEAADVGDAKPDRPIITCDQKGVAKYILGPVEMTGDSIKDATAGMAQTQSGASTGKWGSEHFAQ
jgi:preprotein translocase subunit SecD